MATVTNKSKVLGLEEKVSVTRYRKWKFGLVNFMIQKIRKNGTKIINAFEENKSRKRDFESVNEVKARKRCVSDTGNKKVTMYQSADFF